MWRAGRVALLFLLLPSACDREKKPFPEAGRSATAVPAACVAAPAVPSGPTPPAPSASSVATAPAEGAVPFEPDQWEILAGRWTFQDGVAECECKTNGSVIWRKGAQPRDFDASVSVTFLGDESSAGMVFREVGENFYEGATFYQFEWYTRGTHHDKRLSLMTKQMVWAKEGGLSGPFWIQIVEPKFPEAPYDRWIRLRVRAQGDHLEAFVDRESLAASLPAAATAEVGAGEEWVRVFDKRDPTFVRAGRLGLHVFQPRRTRFRDFRLVQLPGS